MREQALRRSCPLVPLQTAWLTGIIHECRREAAETEARRGFSQVRATQADLRSVEETE
jgi:hypothetical protein